MAVFVVAAAVSLLSSCGSGHSSQGTGTIPSGLEITTSSTLTPAFDPSITDYAFIAPSSGPVQVSVNAPTGTQVSVDGQPAQTLSFTKSVTIAAGQSFEIVVTAGLTSITYYVRCLPTDFPTWTMLRNGTPQAQYYIIAPDISLAVGGPSRHYIIIADANGVPVWWYLSTDYPRNGLLLADGNIAWTLTANAEERTFSGTLVRSFKNDTSIGGALDLHELQQLPNGDFIVIADVNRGPFDLTAYNGLANAMEVDQVIEEIAPNGSLVWSWSATDHISFNQTDAIWWPTYVQGQAIADMYHMNSVEPDGTGFVVSFRHLDAVLRIDKANGQHGMETWWDSDSPEPEIRRRQIW